MADTPTSSATEMRPASTLCTVLKDTSNPNPNAASHTRRASQSFPWLRWLLCIIRCCRRRESMREGDAWKSLRGFGPASAKKLLRVAGRVGLAGGGAGGGGGPASARKLLGVAGGLVLEGRAFDWRCFSGRERVSKTTFMAVGEEAES